MIDLINAERERFRVGFALALYGSIWAGFFLGWFYTSAPWRTACLICCGSIGYTLGRKFYLFIEACRDVRALRRGR